MQLKSRQTQRGPSTWKFNNSLLEDDEFKLHILDEIKAFKNNQDVYQQETPIGVKVEVLLSKFRQISLKRSKGIAQQKRKDENELETAVRNFEQDLNMLSSSQFAEYEVSKEKLNEIKFRKAKAAMLFSKTKWMEDGERATKYFLNRCKQLSAKKTILELADGDKTITDSKEILEACAKHFENLYAKTTGASETEIQTFLRDTKLPQLSQDEKQQCEGDLTLEECTFALKNMSKNKSPGVSGFTPEFLLQFWSELGVLMVDYMNDAQHKKLFVTHRRGLIVLLPKKGDQKLLKNKRPICLLDVIYKLTLARAGGGLMQPPP